MSQHILEVKFPNLCKNFTLVMGYDRPTNDAFWIVRPIGKHHYSSLETPDHTLSSALAELDVDLESSIPLWDAVSKIMDELYNEAVANDEGLAVQELMTLIQDGTPVEEAQAKVQELKSFKDFNRVVNYPDVVLN